MYLREVSWFKWIALFIQISKDFSQFSNLVWKWTCGDKDLFVSRKDLTRSLLKSFTNLGLIECCHLTSIQIFELIKTFRVLIV